MQKEDRESGAKRWMKRRIIASFAIARNMHTSQIQHRYSTNARYTHQKYHMYNTHTSMKRTKKYMNNAKVQLVKYTNRTSKCFKSR